MLCQNCSKFQAIKNIDFSIFLCEVCYDELYLKSGVHKYWSGNFEQKETNDFKPITDFPELVGRTFSFNGELLRIKKEDGTEYLVNKETCSCPARIDLCRHMRYFLQLTNKNSVPVSKTETPFG